MSECLEYALLIDGDNINLSYLEPLTRQIESEGGKIAKMHLFGKLKSSYLDDWKQLCPQSNLVTYNITDKLKNSTDVKMLCVALRLFYSENIRNFIIMSSDSDMESFVNGLYGEANIIVAYSEAKVAQDYLERLKTRNVRCLNLDNLRGPLTDDQITSILNQTMLSYIAFKLGSSFFSYDTVLKWATDRYPELKSLSSEGIHTRFNDLKISFDEDGAHLE